MHIVCVYRALCTEVVLMLIRVDISLKSIPPLPNRKQRKQQVIRKRYFFSQSLRYQHCLVPENKSKGKKFELKETNIA